MCSPCNGWQTLGGTFSALLYSQEDDNTVRTKSSACSYVYLPTNARKSHVMPRRSHYPPSHQPDMLAHHPAMQIVGSARPFLPLRIGWNGALAD